MEGTVDAMAVTFHKMFGYPTGVGALIARRDFLTRLKRLYHLMLPNETRHEEGSSARDDTSFFERFEVRFDRRLRQTAAAYEDICHRVTLYTIKLYPLSHTAFNSWIAICHTSRNGLQPCIIGFANLSPNFATRTIILSSESSLDSRSVFRHSSRFRLSSTPATGRPFLPPWTSFHRHLAHILRVVEVFTLSQTVPVAVQRPLLLSIGARDLSHHDKAHKAPMDIL